MTRADNGKGRDKSLCGGKRRGGEGGLCTRPAGWGTPHPGVGYCKLHGGSTPAHVTRAIALEAARQVDAWGGRLDVTAPEALLELVQTKAAEVAYWNHRVAQLGEDERAGLLVMKTGVGEGPQGSVDTETKQSAAHVFVVLLHKAQDQLAAYSAAAVRAGVDEALVKVAAVQASAVIELARAAVELARRDLTLDADQVLLAVLPGGERL